MPSLIEVWESRLGVKEVPGKGTNPVIDEWCADAGHPELNDNDAWCSVSMASAAKAADLPFPPKNVNAAARSWLTMGVTINPDDVQPGDVLVWPRGNSTWQGHVNCCHEVRTYRGKVQVKAIGGNQSNAVTITDWQNISGVLPNGVRRLVPATVKDLRKAGSTTIKDADGEEKLGIVGAFFVPIFEGARAVIEGMFGSVAPPQFASLPDGLSWWGTLLEVAGRVWGYAAAHPWLAAVLLISIGMVVRSQLRKRGRVAEHAAGIPIAAEVARLETA
jgi:uncharacterized protein (TIGR02594 family)